MELSDNDLSTLMKIDWEGGIYPALDYGVQANDFDNPELRTAWLDLTKAYAAMSSSRQVIEDALENVES